MLLPDDHEQRLARARLSLEGLSTGDAFGEGFFVSPQGLDGLLARRVLHRAPWLWTDDTAMAISVVEVLAELGEADSDALASAFSARYARQPGRGYGPGAHRILGELVRGGDWRTVAGVAFGGQGSFGNGGAMRVAPLGAYFADDLERAASEARRSAVVTHAHPEGEAGAIAIAVAAGLAWQHRAAWPAEPGAWIAQIAAHTPAGETREGLERASAFPPDYSVASAAAILGNGSRISAMDTVPFCVWCVARFGGESWEEALWQTLSALGDRDTTCAIVGGVLALVHGREGIPRAWLEAREPLPA